MINTILHVLAIVLRFLFLILVLNASKFVKTLILTETVLYVFDEQYLKEPNQKCKVLTLGIKKASKDLKLQPIVP